MTFDFIEGTIALFAAVVLVAYAVQTVTGFGSTVVCVTVGASFLPIETVVALAVPISFLQTIYIAVRHHEGIRWRLLFTRVYPAMGAGMAVGFFLFRDTTGNWLKIALGVLVLTLSARELWLLFRASGLRSMPLAASIATMLGAGFVHGVYGTGGPLLVYAMGREGLDKRDLRSTLATVWLVLDLSLTTGFAFDGRYDRQMVINVALLLPALPIGIAIGELLHKRVDERRFRIGLFAMLMIAAIALIAQA